MNATQLKALRDSLESAQRKLSCMQAACDFMHVDHPGVKRIDHPQRAILTAVGLPAFQSLTGEELSDVMIMWRAHVSEAESHG